MKINMLFTLFIAGLFASCAKEDRVPVRAITTINIVNAYPALPALKARTSEATHWSQVTDLLNTNSNRLYFSLSGAGRIQVASSTDSTQLLLDKTLQLKPVTYSLYLSGTFGDLDDLLVEETDLPYQPTGPGYSPDSILNIRFVNLSPSSGPVRVTLTSASEANQFADVAYQQVTAFKAFYAGPTVTNAAFNFQLWDDAGGLLASYPFTTANLNNSRFKNVTLVLRGTAGGTGAAAYGVIFVPNY